MNSPFSKITLSKNTKKTFLQVGANKKVHWKPSSKLERAKKFTGNLPPSWSEQKSSLETFLQVGGYCESDN